MHENYRGYQVRYVSTETFLNEFVDAIRTNAGGSFKRRYRERRRAARRRHPVHREGKEGLQEEFFHTFNALHEADKPDRALVATAARRHPDARGPAPQPVQVGPRSPTSSRPTSRPASPSCARRPSATTAPIPDDVLEFIATHITNNIRELEGALIRVSAYASLNNEPRHRRARPNACWPTSSPTRQPRVITPELILDAIADDVRLLRRGSCGARAGTRPLVTARQIGMYVFRELTDLSYPGHRPASSAAATTRRSSTPSRRSRS